MIREDSFKKHLREGLEGRDFRYTFLLHLLSLLLLLVIGLSVQRSWGIERLLKVTPVLVGALILLEYSIAWVPWHLIFQKVRQTFGLIGASQLLGPAPAWLYAIPTSRTILPWSSRWAIEKEGDVLSIQLSSSHLSESREKLHCIYSLYNECDFVLGTSHVYHKARLAKIETESGGVRAKLFGEPKVISLVLFLIEASLAHMYSSYVNEQRLTHISLQTLQSVFNLEKKLKEVGAETEEMREQIRKSAIRMSHQLNELLADESLVKVNEKVFPTKKDHQFDINTHSNLIVLDTKRWTKQVKNQQ
jgi:hypothetical protein